MKDAAGGKISARGVLTFAQRGRNKDFLKSAKAHLQEQCQGGEEVSIQWKDRTVLVENEVAFRQVRGHDVGKYVGKWAEASGIG